MYRVMKKVMNREDAKKYKGHEEIVSILRVLHYLCIFAVHVFIISDNSLVLSLVKSDPSRAFQ